MYMNFKSILVI